MTPFCLMQKLSSLSVSLNLSGLLAFLPRSQSTSPFSLPLAYLYSLSLSLLDPPLLYLLTHRHSLIPLYSYSLSLQCSDSYLS